MRIFNTLFLLSALLLAPPMRATDIKLVSDSTGHRMEVDGKPFFITGMNWDYYPIGTNYAYSLWDQPDDVIKAALEPEMTLLRDMGVNVIRQYSSVPPRWIEYIFRTYGIYTMLNHSFGRYGLTIDGQWVAKTDYTDPRTRKVLMDEVVQLVNEYKDTPGLLIYLLGNENNYGLFWESGETQDIPIPDRKSTRDAHEMYRLFNDAVLAIKAIDPNVPVAICNGDTIYLDLIAQECPDVDILGLNSYRGISFTDLFDEVKKQYPKPFMFTEFGSDAHNAVTNTEAQTEQAEILLKNWEEIYLNAASLSGAENCLGGFTFQFSDGWWKHGQDVNLEVHDTDPTWVNGGYAFDYVPGKNNMSEEWFGICAKGPTDSRGLYTLYPRVAYYMLKDVHKIDPYAPDVTAHTVVHTFRAIRPADYPVAPSPPSL